MSGERLRPDIAASANVRAWPVLLLLAAVVLVPTICVMWFMNRVTQNEHLAVRKRLTDAYRSHLPILREHLRSRFAESIKSVDLYAANATGSAVFHRAVHEGIADSLICYDAQASQTYPGVNHGSHEDTSLASDVWHKASRLEHVLNDFTAAANAYATFERDALSIQPPDFNAAARALQSQARCFVRNGQEAKAIDILGRSLAKDQFATATDLRGRLIVADAELRALELIRETAHPYPHKEIVDRLEARLRDYSAVQLPASQRLFLMKRLRTLFPNRLDFPTLRAEQLARQFLDFRYGQADIQVDSKAATNGLLLFLFDLQRANTTGPGDSITKGHVLQATGLTHIWQITTPAGRALLLFETEGLTARMAQWMESLELPSEINVAVLPPDSDTPAESVIASASVGEQLPGWRIVLEENDPSFLHSATNRRIAVYSWIAILGIAATAVLASLIAQTIRKQNRLANLKNDLVATITHELKTPLASMRLLVDTLLDTPNWNENQAREYLHLISKENTRLSRLIDNFLAFSRIERNKYAFDFAAISVDDLLNESIDSVHERFQAAACELQIDTQPGLPLVNADRDAMVTVILNLLDNAYKYTGLQKKISLRAFAEGSHVCIEVQDNGVGLSQIEVKRIFKRFYQVDRRLSSGTGGCGLGLSIVQYIVQAHGGTVRVNSELGSGSRFTVLLPAIVGEPTSAAEVA